MKKINLLLVFFLSSPYIYANKIVSPQCYGYLTELVRSSNFPFNTIPKEENNLLVDSDDSNTILAQVNYDKKILGISYDTDRMAVNGWIKYYVNTHKLYNVSADIDPDNPVELSFDKKYASLFENCRSGVVISTQKECIAINDKALSNQFLYSPLENFQVSQSGRSYFYSAPNEKCRISKDLFIIKNDVVQVRGEFNNFYNVIYKKKNGDDVTGWIYKDNLKSSRGERVSFTSDNYNGDPLISKKEFVEGINTSCNIENFYNRSSEQIEKDNKRCVLSKISFPYDKFLNLGDVYPISKLNKGEKVFIDQSGSFNIFIKITKKLIKEGNYNLEITLFTENSNKIIDSLIIYREENDIEAFVAKQQYYFISPSFAISILQVSSVEEGTLLDFWKNYKINDIGKIVLVDSMSCDYSVNSKGICHNK